MARGRLAFGVTSSLVAGGASDRIRVGKTIKSRFMSRKKAPLDAARRPRWSHDAPRDQQALRASDLPRRVAARVSCVGPGSELEVGPHALAQAVVRGCGGSARHPDVDLEVIRDTLFERADDLAALAEARAQVEAKYLDGHPALFPEARTAWDDLLYRSRAMAMTALGLTDRFGGAALDEDRFGATDPERVASYA